MESGSTVIRNEERKKKYQIYVEEYVLSYLRREADSLELSEIYFTVPVRIRAERFLSTGRDAKRRLPCSHSTNPFRSLYAD